MIFIDASRYSLTDKKTGVEHYSVELINAMAKLTPKEITLVSPRKIPLDVPQITIPFPRLWTQLRLSFEILKNPALRGGTLFIPSHQMPLIHPKNTVITVHDVAFKRFPECYSLPSRLYLDWGAKFAVKNAVRIIVPSHVTKDDLVELYHADPEKITVIPHGHSPFSADQIITLPDNLKKQKYFLFIGRLERKKNLLALVRAFEKFSQNHPDFKLILAGKPGVRGEEILKAAKDNPNILTPGYIDDSAKATLLANAFAFVLPSLYEGFGFPLLEAMQFNLPIIASDIKASREVAGEVAIFFDLKNEGELTEKMEQLITSPPNTSCYAEILTRHTWQECAQNTLAVFMSVTPSSSTPRFWRWVFRCLQ